MVVPADPTEAVAVAGEGLQGGLEPQQGGGLEPPQSEGGLIATVGGFAWE